MRWQDTKVGQKVHYKTNDPHDNELLCQVTEKADNHCILKVLGWYFGNQFTPDIGSTWTLYIDRDTCQYCRIWA